jgi:hypothetical protein
MVNHSSVTFVGPFSNTALYSSTLRCGEAPFPYRAESLRWISASGTPSAQKNRITARWSLVHTESGAAMIYLLRHYNSPVNIPKHITIAYGVRASTCTQNKQCSQHNKL